MQPGGTLGGTPLGIMRAFGASTGNIPSFLIGTLSWFLAFILSIPLTALLGQVFEVLLESPMALATSAAGWVPWFSVITAIGSVASAFPARDAARQPVNAALAYE